MYEIWITVYEQFYTSCSCSLCIAGRAGAFTFLVRDLVDRVVGMDSNQMAQPGRSGRSALEREQGTRLTTVFQLHLFYLDDLHRHCLLATGVEGCDRSIHDHRGPRLVRWSQGKKNSSVFLVTESSRALLFFLHRSWLSFTSHKKMYIALLNCWKPVTPCDI